MDASLTLMEDMTKEEVGSCEGSSSLRMAGFSSPSFVSVRNERGGGVSRGWGEEPDGDDSGGFCLGSDSNWSPPSVSAGGRTRVSPSSPSSSEVSLSRVSLLNLKRKTCNNDSGLYLETRVGIIWSV